ncbi:hypothetical protein J5500_04920 [Candidatus Saccharibacteria bacterium]|nr:hypothetical protein [Candidatus Saccharibacteria bacterium]
MDGDNIEEVKKQKHEGVWRELSRPTTGEIIKELRDRLPVELLGEDGNHVRVGEVDEIDEDDREYAIYLVCHEPALGRKNDERSALMAMRHPGVAREVANLMSSEEALSQEPLNGLFTLAFDLLPIEEQAQILFSENAPRLLQELIKDGIAPYDAERRFIAKLSVILQWKIERGETDWIDSFITPDSGCFLGISNAQTESSVWKISQLESLFNDISEHVDDEGKLDLALRRQDPDNLAALLSNNPEIASNMNAAQAFLLGFISNTVRGEDEDENSVSNQISNAIPVQMKSLLGGLKHLSWDSKIEERISCLRQINKANIEQILSQLAEFHNDRNSAIWKRLRIRDINDLVVFDGAGDILEEIAQNWPLSAEMQREIRINMGGRAWQTYVEQYDIVPIKSLDEVRDPKQMYLRRARIFSERKDYSEVRNELCMGLYGIDVEDLAQALISVGAIGSTSQRGQFDEQADMNTAIRMGEEGSANFNFSTRKIEDACEQGVISDKERRLVFESMELLRAQNPFEYFFKTLEERPNEEKWELSHALEKIVNHSRKTITKNISEATRKTFDRATEVVDTIKYENADGEEKAIEVRKMIGDEFMVLGSVVGAFTGNNQDDPRSWNGEVLSEKHGGAAGAGYISTSLICDGRIKLALACGSPEELNAASRGGMLVYAFTDLGEMGILHMGERDLYTERGSSAVYTIKQDYFDEDPRELIAQTRAYNEVVLDRFAMKNIEGAPHGGRLQPGYLVAFVKDESEISEATKEHAAYFGVPIVMIDPWKYWNHSETMSDYAKEKELKKSGRHEVMGERASEIYGHLMDHHT